MNDNSFMEEALKEARAAAGRGECPVGAVFVQNGKIVARAGNEELAQKDPTAHAEILAMRRAGQILGQSTFPNATIYTTLWPCPMCENSMLQAQVPRVVSGAESFSWVRDVRFNKNNIRLEGPIMNDPCRTIFIDWAKKNRPEILERD
jgi:tRNA(adenine34) deaminase